MVPDETAPNSRIERLRDPPVIMHVSAVRERT
jgi:hypothetical protein